MRKIVPPNYNLSPEELADLLGEISREVRERSNEPGITALWIPSDVKEANFIRTHEARNFPEVAKVSTLDEELTTFLALVDCRTDVTSVVHAATLCNSKRATVSKLAERNNGRSGGSSGFICIDELVEMGNFSIDDFSTYYEGRGFDLNVSISVETNFKILRKVEPYFGLGMADLMYYCIFNTLKQNGGLVGKALVFATINVAQIRSFERVGIKFEPLLGRDDMRTAESEWGLHTFPSAIIYDSMAERIFSSLNVPYAEISLSGA